jgi:hypothetical protein
VLSITALLLGMVILGFIATLRRRQWRWLAAIAAFALGTGAALYELARENISPQYTQQGSRSGLILPILEALASGVTHLDAYTLTAYLSVIFWCVLALPLLILLLAYSLATERAGTSADRPGRRVYIALGVVALLLALLVSVDQVILPALPGNSPQAIWVDLVLTVQPLMAVFTVVVAASAGLSALRDRQWGWSAALLLVTSVGALLQLGMLIGLVAHPLARYTFPWSDATRLYYFWYALALGLLMISLPVTTLIYAFAGGRKAQPGGVGMAAQA